MRRPSKQQTSTVNSCEAREELFVAEYLKDFNGIRAATAAGFAPEKARAAYAQLMRRPQVRAALRTAVDKRLQSAEVTTERVLGELSRIAFANVTAFVDVSATGVILRDFNELPEAATAAVQSVKSFPVKGGDLAVSFKLHDKIPALNTLAKYLGLLKDTVSVTGPGGGPLQVQHLSDEALMQIVTGVEDASDG